VYVKDVVGDTALHDAVRRSDDDIINILIACNDVDFKLKNKKGYNVLHKASLHGDVKLVVIITSYLWLLSRPTNLLLTHIVHRIQKKKFSCSVFLSAVDPVSVLPYCAYNCHHEALFMVFNAE